MEKLVKLNDRTFKLYKTEGELLTAVRDVARRINEDYIGKKPLLIPVLNGSFMFAADLLRELLLDCELSFVKVNTPLTGSNGSPVSIIGLNQNIEGRHVILIEDIVDTGHTLGKIIPIFMERTPASLKVASLFLKSLDVRQDITIDYVGMEIPNEFVVGYGMDYDGLGRNLRELYQVVSE